MLVVGPVEIYLPFSGMVDLEAERARLSKELADTQSQIERLEKLLAGDFAGKAPAPVVAKEREKLAAYKETAEKLRTQLKVGGRFNIERSVPKHRHVGTLQP